VHRVQPRGLAGWIWLGLALAGGRAFACRRALRDGSLTSIFSLRGSVWAGRGGFRPARQPWNR